MFSRKCQPQQCHRQRQLFTLKRMAVRDNRFWVALVMHDPFLLGKRDGTKDCHPTHSLSRAPILTQRCQMATITQLSSFSEFTQFKAKLILRRHTYFSSTSKQYSIIQPPITFCEFATVSQDANICETNLSEGIVLLLFRTGFSCLQKDFFAFMWPVE